MNTHRSNSGTSSLVTMSVLLVVLTLMASSPLSLEAATFYPLQTHTVCGSNGFCWGWDLGEYKTTAFATDGEVYQFYWHVLTPEQRATARIIPTNVQRFPFIVLYQNETRRAYLP